MEAWSPSNWHYWLLEGRMESRAIMSTHLNEAQLIAACQRGDRDAFHQLFETYKDRMYTIALHFFGGDEASAKDICQQVFLKLMTGLKQFRSDAEFTTWLYRLVANACIDEWRKRRRWLSLADAPQNDRRFDGRTQEDRVLRRETERAIRSVIGQLKPNLRLVILLKYFEEMSYDEMAGVLNCSPGTVASRLNRAHKALARRLGHLREELFTPTD